MSKATNINRIINYSLKINTNKGKTKVSDYGAQFISKKRFKIIKTNRRVV
jgi:hypothetical protein